MGGHRCPQWGGTTATLAWPRGRPCGRRCGAHPPHAPGAPARSATSAGGRRAAERGGVPARLLAARRREAPSGGSRADGHLLARLASGHRGRYASCSPASREAQRRRGGVRAHGLAGCLTLRGSSAGPVDWNALKPSRPTGGRREVTRSPVLEGSGGTAPPCLESCARSERSAGGATRRSPP